MVSAIGAGLFTAGNFAQSLQNIYNVSDQNGDGFLSLSEFDASGNSKAYAMGLVDAYDRNGDGKLSQAELIAGTMAALAGDLDPVEETKLPLFSPIGEEGAEPLYSRMSAESRLFFLHQFQSVEGVGGKGA